MFLPVLHRLIAPGCILAILACGTPAFAQETTANGRAFYISVQVPGCTDTYPKSINTFLSVTGSCDQGVISNSSNGFVRDARGTITVFDPPGSIYTYPTSINAAGAIAGKFQDSGLLQHGFVRSPEGSFTLFDFPDAVVGQVIGINKSGAIAGSSGQHGFVRSPEGEITSFDPPGSTHTLVDSINDEGVIAGTYITSSGDHGFVRDSSGEFTSFDPFPNSLLFITGPGYSINARGTIAGPYGDPIYDLITHGFVRSQRGTITTFDPPGSLSTAPLSINAKGAVTGWYETNGSVHSFVRSRHGTIVVFDYPGGINTAAASINDFGVITGTYSTAPFPNNHFSGFVRVPGFDEDDEEFRPGTYIVTDNHNLYIDGGFYLYGDPTVGLWVYVAGNPSQQWRFARVSGGFTMWNPGTGQYAIDGGGQLLEGGFADVWTVKPVTEGYTIKNNRTGLFLTDPAVQNATVSLTESGSVWQFSTQ